MASHSEPPPRPEGPVTEDRTTVLLRKAKQSGEASVLNWVRLRFSPVAELNARRLSQLAQKDEAFAQSIAVDAVEILLRRLAAIKPNAMGRLTPVAMRFLFTTVRRLAQNAERKERPHARIAQLHGPSSDSQASVSTDPTDPASPIPELVGRGEEAQRVRDAVLELPDDLREVVELHGLEQLTLRETAERIGTTVNTASGRWTRALGILRGSLLRGSIFDDLDDR